MFGAILLLLVIAVFIHYSSDEMDEKSDGAVGDCIDLFFFWPFHLFSTIVWFVRVVIRRVGATVIGAPNTDGSRNKTKTTTGAIGLHRMHPTIRVGAFVVVLGLVLFKLLTVLVTPDPPWIALPTAITIVICVGSVVALLYSYRVRPGDAIKDEE